MVQRHLARRGIRDAAVLAAMGEVPREEFLPVEMREFAYRDAALPLQDGQTISQPYIVALMAEAMELTADDRVLEVGTGSGYAAAVLSRIAGFVDTVERIPELSATARGRLERLGFSNVAVHTGDGSLGWSPEGPYDAVCVSAAAPAVPQALLEQLTRGGRLVVPIGAPGELQVLTRVRAGPDGWVREPLVEVRFVPLIGEQGWGEGP
jgi:protein-L-isoaspartate(D-aspartate) O-methyltransferase